MQKVIGPVAVRDLSKNDAVTSARVESDGKGLIVVVRIGANERILGTSKWGVRYFKTFNAAISLLRRCGVTRCEVNSENWTAWASARKGQFDAVGNE